MRLPAQILRIPGAPPHLALGLPFGCGEPVRAFLDTAAAFTVVGARHSHALAVRHGRPGRALHGVGGYTPSVDCGELSLVFYSDIRASLNKPSTTYHDPIGTSKVDMSVNCADIFTKPLSGPTFIMHRKTVMGHL